MTVTKNVNYTPEVTTDIVKQYSACETDEARKECLELLSVKYGKNVKSLRAKLVREGVYVKQTVLAKTGAKAETKSAIVESIAAILGVTSEQLPGLDKATKAALNTIRGEFLAASETIRLAHEAIESQAE